MAPSGSKIRIGGGFWWLRWPSIPRFWAWTCKQYIGNAVLDAIWRQGAPDRALEAAHHLDQPVWRPQGPQIALGGIFGGLDGPRFPVSGLGPVINISGMRYSKRSGAEEVRGSL